MKPNFVACCMRGRGFTCRADDEDPHRLDPGHQRGASVYQPGAQSRPRGCARLCSSASREVAILHTIVLTRMCRPNLAMRALSRTGGSSSYQVNVTTNAPWTTYQPRRLRSTLIPVMHMRHIQP